MEIRVEVEEDNLMCDFCGDRITRYDALKLEQKFDIKVQKTITFLTHAECRE